jgi:hypothetical protein
MAYKQIPFRLPELSLFGDKAINIAMRSMGYKGWMQNAASSHRSRETQRNLLRRQIRSIRWPRYSPDLNLIKHVWNWMKNYIQEHYWQARYDVSKVPLDQLKRVIWDAWNAIPNSYIDSLYQSW